MDSLFSPSDEQVTAEAPLAARMRPRCSESVWAAALLAPGSTLRRGDRARPRALDDPARPAGRGKTTLARGSSPRRGRRVRGAVGGPGGPRRGARGDQGARERARPPARRTVLFLDEIHRFNKAQQDALLPAVEDGAGHADRRDDREPVLRGQLGAALALPASTSSRRSPTRTSGARATARSTTASADSASSDSTPTRAPSPFVVEVAHGDARVALNALETAALAAACGPDGRGDRRSPIAGCAPRRSR